MRLHLHGDIDGNGERHAHVAAGTRINLRVDANHLASHVEQRPARIAWIDGDVGLDERNKILLRQRTPLGADDSRRDRAVEAERRADGHHPFAHPEPLRITQFDHRQTAGLDLEQRNIGATVAADHLGLELAFVGQLDQHFVGIVDDVGVGQDITIGADDEAGTERLVAEFPRHARHLAGNESAKELVGRIILVELKTRMTVALDDLGRADIDDRRPLPLCQFGEVGQLPNLGMPGDREHHHEKIK